MTAPASRRGAARPERALSPVKRRQPEKEIQRRIANALRELGCTVNDLSQPRATMLPAGLPDLWWCNTAWKCSGWIEVKAPRGILSSAQTMWHANARAAGEWVWVCHSVEELVAELRGVGVVS